MARKNFKNNKKNTRKPDRRSPREDREKDTGHGPINDWTWYASNAQLLTDAASMSFYNRLGDTIDLDPSTEDGRFSIPGVARLGVIPTYGYSTDHTSPLNVSAQAIYSYVRHQNSGSRNYESSDLMIYCMAADSLYCYLTWITRLYGIMRLYAQTNTYMPKAYVAAMGVNFDDIQRNMPTLLWYINQYASKVATLAVPGGITLYTRHAWMYANVYLDNVDAKAQAYIFSPDLFLKYSPKTSETGGELVPIILHDHDNASHLYTLNEIMDMGDELINAVWGDEDIGIISGDIRKAYGDNLHRVSMIGADYTVNPSYVPEVLSQINNITAMGYVDEYVFKQENNILINTIKLAAYDSGSQYKGNRLLNMKSPIGTDPASVMVATRLTGFGNAYTNSTTPNGAKTVVPTVYGSEIISSIEIMRYDTSTKKIVGIFPGLVYCVDPGTTNVVNAMFNLMNLEYFDWHPMVVNDVSGNMGSRQWVCGDIDNYTVINETDLQKLHDCALLNMFKVPEMGYLA